MVISGKLLDDGERVLLSTRTHAKALLVPAVALIVVAGLTGYLVSLPDGAHAGRWRLVVAVLAALVLLRLVLVPFLRWRATTYTVTDRRLITRSGVLTRRGHDVPLDRISDVSSEAGVLDRLLGCGTLVVSDASENGRIELHDLPRVGDAQLVVSRGLFEGVPRSDDRA